MKTIQRIRQAWDALTGRVKAAGGVDPFLSEKDIRQGFRRISSANSNRDLAPLIQDKMIELAWYLYDRNPMAKRLINLTKVFVIGEGLSVKAEDPDVQDWLRAFWDDPVNHLDMNLPEYVCELGIFGEQLYQASVNPIDGSVRLWYIDPSEIDQVVYAGAMASDRAVAMPLEIKLKLKAGEPAAPVLAAIRPDEDPNSPTFGRLAGNAFYFAVNKAKRSTRGRSDIFALADWLDGYEQFLFTGLDRAELLNSFVWDVTLEDMTPEGIEEWLKKYGRTPRPGSIRAHNQKVKWDTAAPNLGAQDMAETGRQFKNHIVGSAGFPESWFADASQANLATAVEQGGPSFKTLKERQKFVKHMVHYICEFVIDQAVIHGSLARTVERKYEIVAPELEIRDTTKVAAAMQQVTAALSLAKQEGWIRQETATRIFANVASQLGQPVDADQEIEAIATELGPAETDYLNAPKMPGTEKPGVRSQEPGEKPKAGMVQ